MLCKMKIRNNQKCSYCPDEIDYIEHFFFLCPIVRKFWEFITEYVFIHYNVRVNLSVIHVLIGSFDQENTDSLTMLKINHIILIAKMCISIYKKTQSTLSLNMMFEYQIALRKI